MIATTWAHPSGNTAARTQERYISLHCGEFEFVGYSTPRQTLAYEVWGSTPQLAQPIRHSPAPVPLLALGILAQKRQHENSSRLKSAKHKMYY